jgi:hypothetical protein
VPFQEELLRAAKANDVKLSNAAEVAAALHLAPDESLVNVFGGTTPTERKEMLIVTSRATYHVKRGVFGVKVRWVIWHEELELVDVTRVVGPQDFVITKVVLEGGGRSHEFKTGFHSPAYSDEVKRQIALENANLLVDEIRAAVGAAQAPPHVEAPPPPSVTESMSLSSTDSDPASPTAPSAQRGAPFTFDPQGPEKAAQAAQEAYGRQEWLKALEMYVKSVDRLHDFYVFEEFRNRQPSPGDAWMVQGITKSLGVVKTVEPDADVMPLVLEACHRLGAIHLAVEGAGGNPILYKRTLDEIGRLTSDGGPEGVAAT